MAEGDFERPLTRCQANRDVTTWSALLVKIVIRNPPVQVYLLCFRCRISTHDDGPRCKDDSEENSPFIEF